jgi:hypothetical protein
MEASRTNDAGGAGGIGRRGCETVSRRGAGSAVRRRRRPAGGHRGQALSALAVALVVTAVALFAGGCGQSAIPNPATQIDQAKNVAAKAEIVSIETGIRAYQAMGGGQLPPDASQATLGQFVNPWPKNPWTAGPMQPGTGKGDYTYELTSGGFRLTVHLDGGDYSRP